MYAAPVAVLLFSAVLALSQSSDKDVVFSVTSTLVQVDAEVTDNHGHHVTDLKPQDFEVLLDRKPQQITRFSYVNLSAPGVNGSAFAAASGGRIIRPQDVHRSMVLLIDDLTLNSTQIYYLKRALHQWVDRNMQPGDLVALWQTSQFNSVFQEFTSDKTVINAGIDSLHWKVLSDVFLHGEYGPWEATDRVLNTLQELILELRPVGGRKAVVVFTPGLYVGGAGLMTGPTGALFGNASDANFMRHFHQLVDSASRTGTVIYGVDMQGLSPSGNPNLYAGEAGLQILTEPTGGFAVFARNENTYADSLATVADDLRGYYLIGFPAPADIQLNPNAKVDFKRLQVRVKRAGLTIRSRQGFWAETDEAAAPQIGPEEKLRLSLRSLLNQSDILVHVSPFYTQSSDGKPAVRNLIQVDSKNLTFSRQADGKREAKLDLMVTATGNSLDPLASVSKKIVLDADDEQYARIQRDGLLFDMNVPALHPGAYQIRAAVRDEGDNAIGSAGKYIAIPDLKKQRLALTTPLIDQASLPSGERYHGVSAALRQFEPGAVLDFVSVLQTSGEIPADAISGSVQVLHDGEVVLTAPVRLVPVQGKPEHALAGQLKLTNSMAAGSYYLQLTAVSNGRKPAKATSFIDFDVLSPSASTEGTGFAENR